MGCSQTSEARQEEHAITRAEEVLKFHLQSCTSLDLCFRKFTSGEFLNPLQLSRAGSSLSLQISNIGNYNRITMTLNKLKTSEGNYKLIDLIVLSVLLGRDSAETKAKILYQCYDKELKGCLNRDQLTEIANSLVNHSIDTLGGLVSDGQNSYSSDIKNKRYLADIASVKRNAILKLVDFIMLDLENVEENDFIERMAFYHEGRFLNSSTIRELLHSLYLALIPRTTFKSFTVPTQHSDINPKTY